MPTNAEQARLLAKNSTDCSFLLTHLVRQDNRRTNDEAREILESILDITHSPPDPRLKASATGWYGKASSAYIFNPNTGSLDGAINNRAVCFTESTLSGLKAHRDLFKVKYGLAFDRDLLFDKGANPCLNIRESIMKSTTVFVGDRYLRSIYNFIPTKLQPFVNIITDSFDATHEREWRFPGDLQFGWDEVKFIFCPENAFSIFELAQTNAKPCLFDLAWLDRV